MTHQSTATSSLTETANALFSPENSPYVQVILQGVEMKNIGALIADIDGTLGKLTPGNHVLSGPIDAAAPMIQMARFFPTGVLTGRPHKIVETGFDGLLDTEFGFAGTEAGARLVKSGHHIVYERGIKDIESAKKKYQAVMNQYPGGIVEDHTMCSIINGMTNIEQHHHNEVFFKLNELTGLLRADGNEIRVVDGNKPGINVHYNVVPDGVHKGFGIQEIYTAFNINKPLCIAMGDDKADQPMFQHVARHGGITIGVGTNAPDCHIRLNEPEEAVQLLRMMAMRLDM